MRQGLPDDISQIKEAEKLPGSAFRGVGRKDRVMGKENREYKDSVFVDLFYRDETAGANLLSLYNALHGTDLQDEGLIRKVGIEDVLYKNFKNDISFEVNGQVVVFGEHQSTDNPNMPLRCLMYAGRAYEQLVDEDAKYRTKQVKIPTPEFYTFYNGKKDCPLERELCLSDAFMAPPGRNTVELKVTMVNINSGKGHGLLEKCRVLKEYSLFTEEVRSCWNEEEKLKRAISACIEKGILVDYLKRKGSEVRNMLTAEYSYEKDIQVKQWEARMAGMEEGIEKGIEKGRAEERFMLGQIFRLIKKSPDLTDEQVAEALGCTLEEVENIRKIFEI